MIAVILTSLTIVAVLLGPILVKQIERNVELFRRDDHFCRDGAIQFRDDTHRVT
jgi:hypothetical protein